MVYIEDILVEMINNYFPLKDNMKYAQAKFMQASKILKESIDMLFNNLDLVFLQQYLDYKNIDKIKALLIELPYNKITW